MFWENLVKQSSLCENKIEKLNIKSVMTKELKGKEFQLWFNRQEKAILIMKKILK